MSRFAEPQHPAFRAIHFSIDFDRRLWPQDLRGSRAHVRMLAASGIIADAERDEILRGLELVEAELAAGEFAFAEHDEDIHLAVERRLTELVGPVGGKLHTARSRNDQVATDMALFVRDEATVAVARIEALARRVRRRPRRPTSTCRCPATPTCSARSRSTWPTTCWPTCGCCCATASASRSWPGARWPSCRSARARWPGSTSPPTARWSRASSASTASRPTRSTRSPTATSCSTTWARRPPA